VRATLNAAYFFGKPVAATLVVEGFTDVQRNVTFSAQGTTDAEAPPTSRPVRLYRRERARAAWGASTQATVTDSRSQRR
jgi:hypothetical protein